MGTELLLGDIVNTNAQYLSRALCELGIEVYNQQVVGDNRQRLAQAAATAKERCDIVIFSGGLGPTEDDLTKETVAPVYNDQLVYDEATEQKIRQHFERMGRVMTDNNKKQAYIPQKGKSLPNDNGTAPGMVFVDGEKMAILLPGPPRELEPMMEKQVVPMLHRLVKGVIRSRYVKTMGIGESMLETKIGAFLETENPTAALYAKGDGEVTVRLTAKAEDEKQAQEMLDVQYRQLSSQIGEYIYGIDVDNCETVIVNTLRRAMQSVAVAESCTGGRISSRITSVAGASSVFELGVCTYSDKQKVEMLDVEQDIIETYTAVSSEVAVRMAENVRKKADSTYGVATTGYAGPDGADVGLVYIAVATAEKTYVKKFHFAGKREVITNLATQYALDMLRRVMTGLPVENAAVSAPLTAPKKKIKAGRIIATAVMAVVLSVALAFGYLYMQNGKNWANVPVIRDYIKGQTVEQVVSARSSKDFFSQGFEQDTINLISGSWAQNLNLESWIAIKSISAEYAVGPYRLSISQPGSVVYEDTSIAGMKTYAGFDGTTLYTTDSLAAMDKDTEITVFDFAGNVKTYRMFAVLSCTEKQYKGLLKLSDGQDMVDYALRKTVTQFAMTDVTGFDEIIILKQTDSEGNTNLYFAKYFDGSVEVMTTPQPTDSNDESSSDSDDESSSGSTDSSSEAESESANSESEDVSSESEDSSSESENVSSESEDTSSESEPESTPEPTPTVEPTPAVKPTPTPSATPDSSSQTESENSDSESKPESTPEPTPTVKPTPTPTVEPTPTVKPTPTATVEPTPTPTPSASPDSTSEPESTTQPESTAEPEPTPTPTPKPKTLTVTMNGKKVTDKVENILAMIVSREMTSTWNPEALKAQAIASHTFIRYEYARGNTAPAVAGREDPPQSVIDAVSEVKNIIMTTGSGPAYTPYHASSAGRTNSSAEVWGGHYPHLVSVESKYDSQSTGWQSTVLYSKEDMEAVLKQIGIEPKGKPETWFEIVTQTTGGYVAQLKICGQTQYTSPSTGTVQDITGRRLREDILKVNGVAVMRSHAFDVSYSDGTFVFTTYGYGHGVGMSQWGAQLYAQNEGWTYKQILSHYYTGIQYTKVK
ncbi:MAG: competence/damage-inducible protein A [Oscillospiraceae bacterium]|nr:competence/damage-inducible protein A [Oscillospiraceae bacterium]